MVILTNKICTALSKEFAVMITWLEGTIKQIDEHSITIQQNGIGFGVYIPNAYALQVGQTIALHIHLHWNQEQGPTLFGFRSENEKTVFLLIISCPGIGPKIALSILANITIENFLIAVQTNSIATLTAINGIGTKKAEQMIVQLRDKVSKLITIMAIDQHQQLSYWKELSDVLISLNYSRQEVAQALSTLKTDKQIPESFDQALRKALSFLAKRK